MTYHAPHMFDMEDSNGEFEVDCRPPGSPNLWAAARPQVSPHLDDHGLEFQCSGVPLQALANPNQVAPLTPQEANLVQVLRQTLHCSHEVSSRAIARLRMSTSWIKETVRLATLQHVSHLSVKQLGGVLDFEHHVKSISALLLQAKFYPACKCVVFVDMMQGKSQFLYCLRALLVELGENVLYLDESLTKKVVPNDKLEFEDIQFLSEFSSLPLLSQPSAVTVRTAYRKAVDTRETLAFHAFVTQLSRHLARLCPVPRVWVLVDEVTKLADTMGDPPLIRFPEEQSKSPFCWVVTGSRGIATWALRQSLQCVSFALPTFDRDESLRYFEALCNSLRITDREGLAGVRSEYLGEWIDETCGGVPGLIAELCLALKRGSDLMTLFDQLRERVWQLIDESAPGPPETIAKRWIRDIGQGRWKCATNAGICGKNPPQGIILAFVMRYLLENSDDQSPALGLIKSLRSFVGVAPNVDGCLVALEVIASLRTCDGPYSRLEVGKLQLDGNVWIPAEEDSIILPSSDETYYLGDAFYYNATEGVVVTAQPRARNMLQVNLPLGFDLIDVALVEVQLTHCIVYGIRVTNSLDPFAKYHTPDSTPQERSRGQLKALQDAVGRILDRTSEFRFVIFAPKCEIGKQLPRADHTSPFWFGPPALGSVSGARRAVGKGAPVSKNKREKIST